jgi:hypothetical protein
MSFSNDLMSPSRKYTKKERKGNGQNVIHRQNEGVAQWNSAWLASTRPKIQIPVLKKKKKTQAKQTQNEVQMENSFIASFILP